MVRKVVLALVALAVISAGLWVMTRDQLHPPIGDEDKAEVGVRYSYALLTHCGVDFIRFDQRWWEAQPHLDDGFGNPPEGWENGIQQGSLRLVSEDELRFEAFGNKQLRLVPAKVAPDPHICA